MKGRVEGMDGKTTELATSISNINDSSDVINTGLADRRTKIEELNRTRGLLKKLQFIFELPARITRCIDNDRWTEAVQCYKAALPHLDKHKEQDCFNTSRLEAIALIKDLKTKMETRVSDDATSPEQTAECVTLLIQLDSDPGSLRSTYITSRHRCLQNQLEKGKEAASNEDDLLVSVEILGSGFVSEFKELCRSYKTLFLGQDEAANKDALKQLQEFASKIVQDFFEANTEVMSDLDDQPQNLLKAIEIFHSTVGEMAEEVPESGLGPKAEEVPLNRIE